MEYTSIYFVLKILDKILVLGVHWGYRWASWDWQTNGETTVFDCPDVMSNENKFYHAIIDHNTKHHAPISLEKQWGKRYCKQRSGACFLVGINRTKLELDFNNCNTTTMQDLCLFFASWLIYAKIILNRTLFQLIFITVNSKDELRCPSLRHSVNWWYQGNINAKAILNRILF
jgi:hypothetical protein